MLCVTCRLEEATHDTLVPGLRICARCFANRVLDRDPETGVVGVSRMAAPPRVCATCRGKGRVPCGECDGKGTVECDRGHEHDCDDCDGRGEEDCVDCSGKGVVA